MTDSKVNHFNKSLELLQQYIKEKGLRYTSERKIILEEIYNSDQHIDVEHIYQSVNKKISISKATIYNNIELFEQCGIIRKNNFLGKSNIYERNIGNQNHGHFVCKSCQKIIEFCDIRVYLIQKSIEKSLNCQIENSDFLFQGICQECSQKD
ncbi:MAG: transcriptional repressor [Chitinophagales bacterium]|jgi:Fur family ferric uptake transcriptional regulator|nr:transcriptional repressor [Chitinophagales bacterium]